MINFPTSLFQYLSSIDKVVVVDDYFLLSDGNHQYLLKKKDFFTEKIMNYFSSISFPYYCPILNSYQDEYELYLYSDESVDDLNRKGQEMIQAILYLQKNSIEEVEVSEDHFLQFYNQQLKRIDSMMNYYLHLQDTMEEMDYLSSDYYLFITHISLFYECLHMARKKLEEWFSTKIYKMRVSYLIGDLSFSNFHYGKQRYFIHFNDLNKNFFLNDFIRFYRSNSSSISMEEILTKYQEEMDIQPHEASLMYYYLFMPLQIEFSNSIYHNTIQIRREIIYLENIKVFYSEKNEKNEETNE